MQFAQNPNPRATAITHIIYGALWLAGGSAFLVIGYFALPNDRKQLIALWGPVLGGGIELVMGLAALVRSSQKRARDGAADASARPDRGPGTNAWAHPSAPPAEQREETDTHKRGASSHRMRLVRRAGVGDAPAASGEQPNPPQADRPEPPSIPEPVLPGRPPRTGDGRKTAPKTDPAAPAEASPADTPPPALPDEAAAGHQRGPASEAPVRPDSAPGRLNDRFVILRRIQDFPHAPCAFLARDEFLHQQVALLPLPELPPAAAERLAGHCRAIHTLAHPSVLAWYGLFTADKHAELVHLAPGEHFLIMECQDRHVAWDDPMLAQRMRAQGWRAAIQMTMKLAATVDAVQAAGLFAKSLTSDQLYLAAGSEHKLFIPSDPPLPLLQQGGQAGDGAGATHPARVEPAPDAAHQIQALAALLVQTLTGRKLPRTHEELRNSVEGLQGLGAWPARVHRVLRKALLPQPGESFASCLEFASALSLAQAVDLGEYLSEPKQQEVARSGMEQHLVHEILEEAIRLTGRAGVRLEDDPSPAPVPDAIFDQVCARHQARQGAHARLLRTQLALKAVAGMVLLFAAWLHFHPPLQPVVTCRLPGSQAEECVLAVSSSHSVQAMPAASATSIRRGYFSRAAAFVQIRNPLRDYPIVCRFTDSQGTLLYESRYTYLAQWRFGYCYVHIPAHAVLGDLHVSLRVDNGPELKWSGKIVRGGLWGWPASVALLGLVLFLAAPAISRRWMTPRSTGP